MPSSSKSKEKGIHDTPEPSSKSGQRFDELYRLKGVVSVFLSTGTSDEGAGPIRLFMFLNGSSLCLPYRL